MYHRPFIDETDLHNLRTLKDALYFLLLLSFVVTPLFCLAPYLNDRVIWGIGSFFVFVFCFCKRAVVFWYIPFSAGVACSFIFRSVPSSSSALFVVGLLVNAICLASRFFFPSTLEEYFRDPRVIDPNEDNY